MRHHYVMEFLVFCGCVFRYAKYVQGNLVGLLLLVFAGGLVLSIVEDLPLGESIYFACVTGLTIGYGDIAPVTALGRVIGVGIGFVGVLSTGLYVAVATRALADTHYHFAPGKPGRERRRGEQR